MSLAKILVVEDEFILANDIAARLQDLGYEVAGLAASGPEAMDLANSSQPDLVLMDIGLQGSMDGIQTAIKMRTDLNLPVVFLTAYADDSTLQRAKQAEPFGYVLKPFEDRELRTNVEIALYKHRAEREVGRLNRLYATLSQINQAVVRTRSREELLLKICQIAVEFGQFKTAWIALLDDTSGALVLKARAGNDAGIVIGESIDCCGCALAAVREGQPCLINHLVSDPRGERCREMPQKVDFRACAAFPIRMQDTVCGVLAVAVGEKDFFNDVETRLLAEIALDISFALDTLVSERQRQEAESALLKSERQYSALFENMAEGFAYCKMLFDEDGNPQDFVYVAVNRAFGALTGLDNVIGRKVSEVIPGIKEWHPEVFEIYGRVARTGRAETFEIDFKLLGARLAVSAYSFEQDYFAAVFSDITAQKRLEEERQITIDFFRFVNFSSGTRDLVRSTVTFFQERSGCDAVGIRLREGDDYPYFEARGFPKEFLQVENSLCARDSSGQIIRNGKGEPIIDCMCGNVICGRFDPLKPFFTTAGSFWSNGTTELLARTTDADRQTKTRNRCNGEGYESVALIPLRVAEKRLGLLQLNDRSKGKFSPAMIAAWERIAGYLAVALEKCRAEESQRQSEDWFHAVVEHLDEAVLIADLHGRWLHWNRAAITMYGFATLEECPRYLSELITIFEFSRADGTVWSRDDLPLARILRGEQLRDVEINVRRLEGNWNRVFSYSGTLTRNDSGDPEFAVLAVRDITQRKRAEQDLRESEDRFRSVVEGAPDGMIVQVGGSIRYLNPAALAMFAAEKPDQLVGHNYWDRIHPDYHETAHERLRILQEKYKSVPSIEELFVRLDGTPFDVEVTASPFTFEGRDGSIVFFRDIAARKSAERKIQDLEQQFRQAQKLEALGRLAGGIAHDYNNILMVIRGQTEMLEECLQKDEHSQKHTHEVLKATERAAGLTRQLLAFSRKQMISPVALDLNAVVGETAKMLQRLIGEDIELRVCPGEALWAVRADHDQMVQVLMNLSVNARDAMPQGGTLTILTSNEIVGEGTSRRPSYVSSGEYVSVAVRDTGHGISKDIQEKLFEPFFTTKEMGKGTGLGLSTVYGIVKQSGGYIWVDSEPKQGACFTVLLPSIPGTAEAATPTSVELTKRGTETLLLVEDEQGLRDVICDSLRSLGYTVLSADSGQRALSMAKEASGRIDLLITDVVMPGMSGRELSEILTGLRPRLKTIYMSGYTDDSVLRHGVQEDGMPFLQKPFNLTALARKVREVMDAPASLRPQIPK